MMAFMPVKTASAWAVVCITVTGVPPPPRLINHLSPRACEAAISEMRAAFTWFACGAKVIVCPPPPRANAAIFTL